MRSVTADDLRRFAKRDWTSAAVGKLDYWAEQYRLHGAGPARTASTALLLHMQTAQPGFPSRSDRDADLSDHLAHRHRLDRAAHAFTRR